MADDPQLYPEHAKLLEHRKLSDVTQELGEHLESSGQVLCELRCVNCGQQPGDWDTWCPAKERARHDRMEYDVQWTPVRGSIISQLASIFGIDQDALEREKRHMVGVVDGG